MFVSFNNCIYILCLDIILTISDLLYICRSSICIGNIYPVGINDMNNTYKIILMISISVLYTFYQLINFALYIVGRSIVFQCNIAMYNNKLYFVI